MVILPSEFRDRVDEFVNIVGENGNVINLQETSENVTLEYVDIEQEKTGD